MNRSPETIILQKWSQYLDRSLDNLCIFVLVICYRNLKLINFPYLLHVNVQFFIFTQNDITIFVE